MYTSVFICKESQESYSLDSTTVPDALLSYTIAEKNGRNELPLCLLLVKFAREI